MQKLGPALHRLPDAAVRAFLATFFRRGHDNPERAREALDVYWPAYAQHGASDTLARHITSLRTADTLAVADRLPSLQVPARVMWGAADRFQKVDYGERLAWDLGAELDRVEGGKHWMPEDHPDAIAVGLKDLLAAVS